MKRCVLALLLVSSSCSRCGQPQVIDAGAPHVKRQADLRSTLLVAYPEYRGTRVTSGRAVLTRRVLGEPAEAEAAAMKTLESHQFARSGEAWVRAPYKVTISGAAYAIEVPLDQDMVGKLFMAPTAMGSTDMAMWFPRGAGSMPVAFETFELELGYLASSPHRAEFLTRQLITLLLGNSQWRAPRLPLDWDVDGGQPDAFEALLEQPSNHATLAIRRAQSEVFLHYTLVTDEPSPL